MTNRYRLRKKYEKWKDIPEYEGIYQISNLGKIRTLDRTLIRKTRSCFGKTQKIEGKILKLRNSFGYEQIGLSNDNGVTYFKIHRLVIGIFKSIDGFELKKNNNHKKIQVDHINDRKNDNRLKNLQYLSASDNIKKSFKKGKISSFIEYNKNNPPWNKGLKNNCSDYVKN